MLYICSSKANKLIQVEDDQPKGKMNCMAILDADKEMYIGSKFENAGFRSEACSRMC